MPINNLKLKQVIVAYLDGLYPLLTSCLCFGVLGGMFIIGASRIALAGVLNLELSIAGESAAMLIWLTFCSVLWLWIVVGIWRSASGEQKLAKWIGRAAVALASLALVPTGLRSASSMREYVVLAQGRDPMGPPAKVMVAANRLLIEGTLSQGTARLVARALSRSPGVDTIQISSPGGRMGEARSIARLVKGRQANTVAGKQCMSACTVVLLSGRHRSSIGDSVGFHQVAFPGFDANELIEANTQLRNIYTEFGLPKKFIDQALARSANDMWYPNELELFSAGALTRMAQERISRVNKASAKEINVKAPTVLDDLTTLLGARASGSKLIFIYQLKVDQSNLEIDETGRLLKKYNQRVICGRALAPEMLASGAIFEHQFVDQDGVFITSYQITRCGVPE